MATFSHRLARYGLLLLLAGAWGATGVRADEDTPERIEAEDGCPSIKHVPVLQVPRGMPTVVAAHVECPTGAVVEVLVYVRPGDIGPSTPMEGQGKEGGLYEVTIPFSMIRGIDRFWYYIDATATNHRGERVYVQSKWYPVRVIDPAAAAMLLDDSASGGSSRAILAKWITTGLAVLGGALIVENNDNSSSAPADDPIVASTPSKERGKRASRSANVAPPPPPPPPPPDDEESTCITPTGNEAVSLGNASYCAEGPIEIYLCGACPDATVRVTTTWGVDVTIPNVTSGTCPPGPPAVASITRLFEPGEPLSETISVYVNGVLVSSIGWPLLDDPCDDIDIGI